MPINYKAPQYNSMYVPTDTATIATALKQRQEREDAINQSFDQTIAKLNETQTYHPELYNKVMDNLRSGFDDLYMQSAGNFNDNFDSALRYITNARSDPFWKLNDSYNKAMEQENAIRNQAQAEGRVLEFDSLRNKKLLDENGRYVNPNTFTFDIERQLGWANKMEDTWAYALQEEGGSNEIYDAGSRQMKKTTYQGVNENQRNRKYKSAWAMYSSTPEYFQQERWYIKEAKDANPNLSNEDAKKIAQVKIANEFLDASNLKLHTTNYSVDYSAAPNFGGWGGGSSTDGAVQVHPETYKALDSVISKMSANDLRNAYQNPSDARAGVARQVMSNIKDLSIVKLRTKRITETANALLAKAKTMPDYNKDKFKLIESGNNTNQEEYNKEFGKLAKFVSMSMFKSNPKLAPNTIASDADKLVQDYDYTFDTQFENVKKNGLSTIIPSFGFNTASGDVKSVEMTQKAAKGVDTELYNNFKDNSQVFLDLETGKALDKDKISGESLRFISTHGNNTTGAMIKVGYREVGNTAGPERTALIKISDPTIERNVLNRIDDATEGKFFASLDDSYKVDNNGEIYNRVDGTTNNELTNRFKGLGVKIQPITANENGVTSTNYAFINTNTGKPITLGDLIETAKRKYVGGRIMSDTQRELQARADVQMAKAGVDARGDLDTPINVTSSAFFNKIANLLK